MGATTKRELVRKIAEETGYRQHMVKEVVQRFLDLIIDELGQGNRLEFREFGIFQTVVKKERMARNPRTGDPVFVPTKASVHFKTGRKMKEVVSSIPQSILLKLIEQDQQRKQKQKKSRAGKSSNSAEQQVRAD